MSIPLETPATAFHPADYIEDEMRARGWSRDDLARRMGDDFATERLALDLYLETRDGGLRIGEDGAAQLARAFGTSAELWVRLERAWLASRERRAAVPRPRATPGGTGLGTGGEED